MSIYFRGFFLKILAKKTYICYNEDNVITNILVYGEHMALNFYGSALRQDIFAAAHAHGNTDIPGMLLDALIDTAKMIPFLFLAFMLMEFIEHKAGDKLESVLKKSSGLIYGPAAGAIAGCVPQCGFSVAAANLYSGRIISMGTLAAVFISTSDEAVPVLAAHPDKISVIIPLLLTKIVLAFLSGIIIDAVIRLLKRGREEILHFEEFCSDCGCGEHGIWYSALKHTLKITLFILAVNVVMSLVMGLAGKEAVSDFLDGMGAFQPFAAALAGLIPNCASSVLITELYADGVIPFGSAAAGLSTGAGLGFAVLFRSNKSMKENFAILGTVYFIGSLAGIVINLFPAL